MVRPTAIAAAMAGTVLLASVFGRSVVAAQQAAPPQAAATQAQGAKALDEQKSAPIQIVNRDYDLQALKNEPKVPEQIFRGRVVWVQKCAFCHDGLGQPTYKTLGPWLDQDLVKALTDDGTKAFIMAGDARMPGFKYNLNPAQLDDVLAFLKAIPASAKPTPAQLAGKQAGRD